MDLDEMKLAWSEMNDQLEQQKRLTSDIILKMTQEKSTSRLRRIVMMEGFGVIMTAVALIVIIGNFNRLENWAEVTGGIGTIMILGFAIGFGIKLIRQALQINLFKNSFQETLKRFNAFRKSLGFYKRISIIINAVSPIFLFPVAFGMFTEIDLIENPKAGLYGLIGAAVFIPLVLYLIIRFYKGNISTVKKAFDDFEEQL